MRKVGPVPVPSTITKTYPQRGPLQQFRFATATAFRCFRCGATKKSKLITIYHSDWTRQLCNGCYGRLLSLYEIKAGTDSNDERAEQMALLLISLARVNDRRNTEHRLLASETRAKYLCPESLKFLAIAEFVASQLGSKPELEWSPAIVGLCKAVEVEVINRLILPLAQRVASKDISNDERDEDIGRVAAFCANPKRNPPELGGISHFLQTTIHSQRRRESSVLMGAFLQLASDWAGSQWILDPNGICNSLSKLRTDFRNKSAHIDAMSEMHYRQCRKLVMGTDGVLWKLTLSVAKH